MFLERWNRRLSPEANEYRFAAWIFGISLVIHLIAAWFSLGFYHYDEHFQILEFAGYKAGLTHAQVLPWEFNAQIRPTIQPWIAFLTIRLFQALQIFDPFSVATFLRLLSALVGWFSMLLLTWELKFTINKGWARKLLIFLGVLLSILLFVHIRFSSESWSGSFFFLGIALYYRYKRLQVHEALTFSGVGTISHRLNLVVIGFLLGISCVLRFQSGILVAGFFGWLLLVDRQKIRRLTLIAVGLILAVILGFVLDRLFYGNWVNTAWRYFIFNILRGKAAEFGVQPWWWYAANLRFINDLWPFKFFLLVACLIALVSSPKNPFTWILLPFILIHLVIGHKEARFFFPIFDSVPYLVVLFVIKVFNLLNAAMVKSKRLTTIIAWTIFSVFFVSNGISLAKICSTPTHHGRFLKVIRFIYHDYPSDQNLELIITNYGFYQMMNGALPYNFYTHQNLHSVYLTTPHQIMAFASSSKNTVILIDENRGFRLSGNLQSIDSDFRLVYSTIPPYMKSMDFNGWIERTGCWKAYQFMRR